MFDWVLNTPLNNSFFSWRVQSEVNDISNCFSKISFSYQYLPEAYLEPIQTYTVKLFCENSERHYVCPP